MPVKTTRPPTSLVLPHEPDTFDHGRVSGFNAWFFRTFDRLVNMCLRPHKDDAYAGLGAGTVLEIGAGVGANLTRLAPGTHLVAVEPSARMHEPLRARAADAGVELTLVGGRAESLPLPDASVDAVVCSLVLCTVDDPATALAEVRRVLRPGGTFRFVEHVVAPHRGPRRWLQDALHAPWSWLFEGCQTDRDTARAIADAGFAEVEIEHGLMHRSVFFPVNTTIHGIATA